jgi:RNA polymerase sigma-70 factor (ECF subfamily)
MFTTPVSLLERLHQPEADAAWQRFVKLYTPLLYSWACRLGMQEPDAADLVQDVLTLLVQKLPEFRYDKDRSFRAWLRTVMMNRWRNDHRRRPVAALGSGVRDLADADEGDPLEEAEYRQYIIARAMELMQAEFQPVTWQAFWEHMVVGQTPAAVAEKLGISIDSVYAAKSRVLRRLRQELDGLLD